MRRARWIPDVTRAELARRPRARKILNRRASASRPRSARSGARCGSGHPPQGRGGRVQAAGASVGVARMIPLAALTQARQAAKSPADTRGATPSAASPSRRMRMTLSRPAMRRRAASIVKAALRWLPATRRGSSMLRLKAVSSALLAIPACRRVASDCAEGCSPRSSPNTASAEAAWAAIAFRTSATAR
jgi:hypothetical protein